MRDKLSWIIRARRPRERNYSWVTPIWRHEASGGCNAKARLAVACPVTSQVKGYPFEVALPPHGAIAGAVLADHIKNLDWEARRVVFEAKAPAEVLADVRERLRALLGL